MFFSLLAASIHTLGAFPSLEQSSQWLLPSIGWHASQPYVNAPLHRSSHLIHGVIPHGPSAFPSTRIGANDWDLGELGIVYADRDPKMGKPIYTCPTFIYTFDCDECGGPKEITSDQPTGGTTNALCLGVGASSGSILSFLRR